MNDTSPTKRIGELERENSELRSLLTLLADCYFKHRNEGIMELMMRADRILTGRTDETMNDYWNDPPEEPEPPECCGDLMDITEAGACVCPKCGKRIEPVSDIDPEPDVQLPDNYFRESN